MKRIFLFTTLSVLMMSAQAQNKSAAVLDNYRQHYIRTHEVVGEADRKYFRFFPFSRAFIVTASFAPIKDTTGFMMKSSGETPSRYFRYGKLTFSIHDTTLELTIYRNQALMLSKEYQDYLFIPFTDLTSGEESYGGGKYLDLSTKDIRNNRLLIDFNKAYNPYCAYASEYNCPIPPKENDLRVAIKAGEMNFGKAH